MHLKLHSKTDFTISHAALTASEKLVADNFLNIKTDLADGKIISESDLEKIYTSPAHSYCVAWLWQKHKNYQFENFKLKRAELAVCATPKYASLFAANIDGADIALLHPFIIQNEFYSIALIHGALFSKPEIIDYILNIPIWQRILSTAINTVVSEEAVGAYNIFGYKTYYEQIICKEPRNIVHFLQKEPLANFENCERHFLQEIDVIELINFVEMFPDRCNIDLIMNRINEINNTPYRGWAPIADKETIQIRIKELITKVPRVKESTAWMNLCMQIVIE